MNRITPHPDQRHGLATLLVLVLISVALAVTYALVRSQGTVSLLQTNDRLRATARQAALTGMAVARRTLHTADWPGADSTLTGSAGPHASYLIQFTTGDPALTPADPDFPDYPYRLTVQVTGSSADPTDPQRAATQRLAAVFRLTARALASEPPLWETISRYTFFQSKADTTVLNVPCGIEGPVRLQGRLELAEGLHWSTAARQRYLVDLNRMRRATDRDQRPLTGPVEMPFDRQSAGLVALLEQGMEVSLTDEPPTAVSLRPDGFADSYQLYPGGKVYSAQRLGPILRNRTLQPDPLTNPLGIFVRRGRLDLWDGVTIRGTLVVRGASNGDVHIWGHAVRLAPVDLPPLYGSELPVRLPTLVLEDDLRLRPGCEGSIEGMVFVGHEYDVRSDWQSGIQMPIRGHLVARRVLVRPRFPWIRWPHWWNQQYQEFVAQAASGIPHFPQWLASEAGLDPTPRITISPADSPARYHWRRPGDPIYVPHPEDEGLRWELLRWIEEPQ